MLISKGDNWVTYRRISNHFFFFFQVYELTLHYTQHRDHNVVTGALELLQQIFRTPPIELLHVLTSSGGIQHVTICRDESQNRIRSSSIVELIGK